MTFKKYLLLAIFITTKFVYGQKDLRNLDFTAPDSIAKTIKYEHADLIKLSSDLTSPFNSDILKTRAIYRWLIENIGYDYKFINKGKEIKWPDCDDKPNCKELHEAFRLELMKKALKDKIAICDGYAHLFKTMCDFAKVKCEIVTGAVRTKPYQLGNHTPSDHAWNAVLIDSNWYFIDATWAAGGCAEDEETGKLLPFKKNENDLYFLTSYDKLIKDHRPDSARWLSLLKNTTKEKFNNQTFYYNQAHFIKYLENVLPDSGVINAKLGDTLRFTFSYPFLIEKIQLNTNLKQNMSVFKPHKKDERPVIDTDAVKRQTYWPFEKNGNHYTIKFLITDRSLYYIDISFKYTAHPEAVKVLRYRINIPWTNK